VWNLGEQRMAEYTPFSNWWKGRGTDYVAFLVDTLKPMIDRTFRTRADAAHTGIVGSSLGGLIAAYAFFARPDVFGLCGALSPAFWPGGGEIYKIARRAPRNPGRIYLDNGTREPSAHKMFETLQAHGHVADRDICWVEEQGGRHNEAAWARRFPDAARFLLKPR
jgi:isoamylase